MGPKSKVQSPKSFPLRTVGFDLGLSLAHAPLTPLPGDIGIEQRCRAGFPACRFAALFSAAAAFEQRFRGLESPLNRQAGKPALHCWRADQD
ncbi:MAG: hypothetical protein C5B50_10965 [Verrucomicrobia bacterium]|nr:MAG: hypothetical protein C5B50_10965 [Verrucomicrobiota bacterium]